MTIYEFVDVKTNEGIDLDFPMGEAPSIGDELEFEGRTIRRVISHFQAPIVAGDFFTNFQVRRGSKESEGAPGYDDKGRPVFTTKAQARDFAAQKSGDGIVQIEFDT